MDKFCGQKSPKISLILVKIDIYDEKMKNKQKPWYRERYNGMKKCLLTSWSFYFFGYLSHLNGSDQQTHFNIKQIEPKQT